MSRINVKDIEEAVAELNREEFTEFSQWFSKYQAAIWDEQIREDLDKGRLDDILNEVDEEYKSGNVKPL